MQIASQAFTFLLAGYETTANALAFTTYLLESKPDKEAAMVAEIDAFGRDRVANYDDLPAVNSYKAHRHALLKFHTSSGLHRRLHSYVLELCKLRCASCSSRMWMRS